jgi:hypothetical protein
MATEQAYSKSMLALLLLIDSFDTILLPAGND